MEQTLSIIKPDGVQKGKVGEILARFEKAGLKVVAAKMTRLTREEAKKFYAIHAHRPFYNDLVSFMTEGPIFVSVLEGKNAVATHRSIMGATDPKEAAEGTVRRDFAESIDRNVVHGSDSLENGTKEIRFFFDRCEIQSDHPKSSSSCCCC